MKVLVVGAAGKTGRLVVERALAAGHQVVALVHREEDEAKHPLTAGAQVEQGDVRNPARLTQVMEGCEAVVDALGGHTPWAKTDLETSAAKVVLEVMGRVGAKRLLVVSVMGAHESKLQAPWMYEHLLMPIFLHGAMQDKNAMEDVVMASQVAWTLVRPPVLTDGEATGVVQAVPAGVEAHRLTRADLAQFLVDQLASPAYVGQAVTVANS